MQSRVVVIAPPQAFISLAEVKAHLRIDDDAEDSLLAVLIQAAQQSIDGPGGWLGRSIGRQTLELRLDGFPRCGALELPFPSAVSVVDVKYDDAAGASQEMPSDSFRLDGQILSLAARGSWPSVAAHRESARIRYVAGYNDGAVPAPIRAAALLMVGDLWRFRDSVVPGASVAAPVSTTVASLLSPFQVWR